MKSKGSGPFLSQFLLNRDAGLDARTRQEKPQAAACGAIRFELVHRAQRGEISRVVQVNSRVEGESATQHHAITCPYPGERSTASGAGCGSRLGRGVRCRWQMAQ